jgi:hypothetical protein
LGASFLAASFLLGSALFASSFAGSTLVGSEIGAVATSAGLVAGAACSAALFASVLFASVLAVSADGVSSLKSEAVGGGTLAGSGRGTAASIASSAAELRGVSLCANAEFADRHQDAVISSTVLPTITHRHTPWVSRPAPEQPWFVRQSFRKSADLIGF